ncbi:MAG: molybdopterin-dependent oxidoreductase [Deltaproteobacteria bacterium]|nr:molybdopterin-dependent oxidoreductase [Deltaproteobacteria bacterium]
MGTESNGGKARDRRPCVKWTRREFLRASALAATGLVLSNLQLEGWSSAEAAESPLLSMPTTIPLYREWEDLYRKQWVWDSVARGTHTMTNCVSGCSWDLYVKDGMVWREEQHSPYEASMPGLPDFNPRGCQKGACGSVLMHSPSRVRYPLRRVGERGEDRWKRISWEEALDAVAVGLVDAIEKEGPQSVLCELGPNIGSGPNSAAPLRFFRMLGSAATDANGQIGDLLPGPTITLGNGHPCGSSDDWCRSSYLVLWSYNPSATRIPDAHFLYESRYRGAKLVAVCPDLNNSAIHADLWLNPNPGTDAALALGAAQVIVSEALHDVAYVTEQTDLPLLVRTDTGRFLRPADLGRSDPDPTFFVWDGGRNEAVPAPGTGASDSLAMEGRNTALDFTGSVKAGGKSISVRTVFSLLREKLDRDYQPETVATITGVAATTIREFARGFAAAPAAMILSEFGGCKFLHADLNQRAQILLASLTGNIGRAGGGWRASGFFAPEGFALLAMQEQLGLLNLGVFAARALMWPAEAEHEFARYFVPGTLWHAVHGGLDKISGDSRYGDVTSPRPVAEYLKEALDKKWFTLFPAPGKKPQVLLSIFGNVLRHSRQNVRLRETLLDKVKLLVDVNFRMSETGRWADIILPAAFWYEKIDLKYLASFIPYLHLGDRAAPPLGEAKPEWEIFALLSAAVAREARRRDLAPYSDIAEVTRDARRLDEAFTDSGRLGPGDEEAAMEFVLKYSTAAGNTSLAGLRQAGAVRFASTGQPGSLAGYYSDYSENEPLVPQRWFVEKKQPWPTLTGRQQFYIDHPWFLECAEALPTYKPPPGAGGSFPLVMSGGHTRWSIHSQWRDQQPMLRLQRGEPVVYVSADDAERRNIKDHDLVRVRNDLGAFVLRAKVAPYVRPGEVIVYHAWEPYQFRGGLSDHSIIPSPLKATSLVGDYGQLRWTYGHWEPNQVDRDTRVEVELV